MIKTLSEKLLYYASRWFKDVHCKKDIVYITQFIETAFNKEMFFQYLKKEDVHYEEMLVQIHFDFIGEGINEKEISQTEID